MELVLLVLVSGLVAACVYWPLKRWVLTDRLAGSLETAMVLLPATILGLGFLAIVVGMTVTGEPWSVGVSGAVLVTAPIWRFTQVMKVPPPGGSGH